MDANAMMEKHENMSRSTTTRLMSAREFTCYVRQKDDICYQLKFREDSKGQDVMDEVYINFFLCKLHKVQSPSRLPVTTRSIE